MTTVSRSDQKKDGTSATGSRTGSRDRMEEAAFQYSNPQKKIPIFSFLL